MIGVTMSCGTARSGMALCRLAVFSGIICSTLACVWADVRERQWSTEIARDRQESAWLFESRVRLTMPIAPLPGITLAFNHDRFTYTSVVMGDRLLLIGSQRWEFYYHDTDYVYLVDLPSGQLCLEKPLGFNVGGVYCGEGDHVAYKSWRSNVSDRAWTERLVVSRLPTAEVVGEIDIDKLEAKDDIGLIHVSGLVMMVRDSQGRHTHYLLEHTEADGRPQAARSLTPEEVDRLTSDERRYETLRPARWVTDHTTIYWRNSEIHIRPIWVWVAKAGSVRADKRVKPSHLRGHKRCCPARPESPSCCCLNEDQSRHTVSSQASLSEYSVNRVHESTAYRSEAF